MESRRDDAKKRETYWEGSRLAFSDLGRDGLIQRESLRDPWSECHWVRLIRNAR